MSYVLQISSIYYYYHLKLFLFADISSLRVLLFGHIWRRDTGKRKRWCYLLSRDIPASIVEWGAALSYYVFLIFSQSGVCAFLNLSAYWSMPKICGVLFSSHISYVPMFSVILLF